MNFLNGTTSQGISFKISSCTLISVLRLLFEPNTVLDFIKGQIQIQEVGGGQSKSECEIKGLFEKCFRKIWRVSLFKSYILHSLVSRYIVTHIHKHTSHRKSKTKYKHHKGKPKHTYHKRKTTQTNKNQRDTQKLLEVMMDR